MVLKVSQRTLNESTMTITHGETILRLTGWDQLTYSNVGGWKVLYDFKWPCMCGSRDRWAITLFGGWRFEGNKRSKKKIFLSHWCHFTFCQATDCWNQAPYTERPALFPLCLIILNDSSVVSPVLLKVKHLNWSCKVKEQIIIIIKKMMFSFSLAGPALLKAQYSHLILFLTFHCRLYHLHCNNQHCHCHWRGVKSSGVKKYSDPLLKLK